MLLHFGSVPALVVSSAEAAREILKTHDLTFSDRPKSTIFEKLLYNYKDVSTAPYGEYWRLQSGGTNESSVVNLTEMFVTLTNDVICNCLGEEVLWWRRWENVKGDFGEVYGVIGTSCNWRLYIPWLAWLSSFNGLDARLDKVAKKFDDFLDAIVLL
ncbi:unnamed protein product [Prunus brigantina]